jgi:hypothetical protein
VIDAGHHKVVYGAISVASANDRHQPAFARFRSSGERAAYGATSPLAAVAVKDRNPPNSVTQLRIRNGPSCPEAAIHDQWLGRVVL